MKSTDQKRAVLIVLDSVGCGEAPDAANFGDVGANTLAHIKEAVPTFHTPNLLKLGLSHIPTLHTLNDTNTPAPTPTAAFGRMQEVALGKDTATGHWEFVGCVPDQPFKTYMENGFPREMIDEFIEKTGCKNILGNLAASGTEIIKELGPEHQKTGFPIVYTSADPVFQIAAHEKTIPLETLYQWCKIAYDIVIPKGICRVIARPFIGDFPNYSRTSNRHDYTFPPPKRTVLDNLVDNQIHVTGLGKIPDIYSNRGISSGEHTTCNNDGIDKTIQAIKNQHGLIFTNLVDFDAKYGHRRDPEGYAQCLQDFDQRLPEIIEALDVGDLLIITADHGNDPTFPGTDHTREYVPLLALIATDTPSPEQPQGGANVDLGTRKTFADLGATLADFFNVDSPMGESFLHQLTNTHP